MKPGFLNTGMIVDGKMQLCGYDERFDHCDSWGFFWEVAIYEITINKAYPLMFQEADGRLWRTDNHYWTDFGSIPPLLRSLPGLGQQDHKFPYMFHDSAYHEKGLWCSVDDGETWFFQKMTRGECDDFLCLTVEYDVNPGGFVNRNAIWLGVRAGGFMGYGRGDYRKRGVS